MNEFIAHWLSGLGAQTLCLSAVLIALVSLRPWLLRGLGATAMYALWLSVPLALLALALPAPPGSADMQPTVLLRLKAAAFAQWQNPLDAIPALAEQVDGRSAVPLLSVVLFAVWLMGAFVCFCWIGWAHYRLLGQLRAQAGTWRSPAGSGPAVVGFLRARLCLPSDFEQRFSDDERLLILAHESVHLRRHDNLFNLLASLLCCVHWFNPLCWLALRRWRADQELSCDAHVLRLQAPSALAPYARALVKAHNLTPLIARSPSIVCTWQAQHPLLERVTMLKLHRSLPVWRRRAALVFSLSAGLLGAGLVHAISAEPAGGKVVPPVVQGWHYVEIDMDLQINGKMKREVRVTTMRANGQWVSSGKKDVGLAEKPWVVRVYATPASDTTFRLELVVAHLDPALPKFLVEGLTAQGRVVAKPVVVVKAGEKARIEITDDQTKEVLGVDLTPRWILKEDNVLDAVKDRS